MNTNELKRQCGLILDLADQNIEELERLKEEPRRTADMRVDLQEIWPLIENAPEALAALKAIHTHMVNKDDCPAIIEALASNAIAAVEGHTTP